MLHLPMTRVLSLPVLLMVLPACGFISATGYEQRQLQYDQDQDGHLGTAFGGDDCDDDDAEAYPGAVERCNGSDDDCDGTEDSPGPDTLYADADGDGYGDPDQQMAGCLGAEGLVENNEDCDDTTSSVNPLAAEVCNDVDDNCDGLIDALDSALIGGVEFWFDNDGDGYSGGTTSTTACTAPDGFVYVSIDAPNLDCNDADATVNPEEVERCDGVDNDCDGATDDATAQDARLWYADADGDGFGDESWVEAACRPYAAEDDDGNTVVFVPGPKLNDPDFEFDCDDTDLSVFPGATVTECDLVDTDCDGVVEESIVAPDGSYDFDTVQGAIDARADGGLICVTPGFYLEDIDFKGFDLQLRASGEAEETFLLGTGSGPVVVIESGEPDTVLLDGFGIAGGTERVLPTETRTVKQRFGEEVDIEVNISGGGGVFVDGVSPTLRNLVIVDNHAFQEDGEVRGAGLYLLDSSAKVEDVVLADNSARASADEIGTALVGGIVYAEGGSPKFSRLVMFQNYCAVQYAEGDGPRVSGGRVALSGCAFGLVDSSTRIENLLAFANTAEAIGGRSDVGAAVLHVGGDANPLVENATIAGNTAYSDGEVLGIINHAGKVVIGLTNVDISYNDLHPLRLYSRSYEAPRENEDEEVVGVALPVVLGVEQGGDYMLRYTNIFGNTVVFEDAKGVIPVGELSLEQLLVLGLENHPDPVLEFPIEDGETLAAPVLKEVYAGGDEPTRIRPFVTWTVGEGTGNHDVEPGYLGGDPFEIHLADYSLLVDQGDPNLLDTDGTRSDIGVYGGPNPLAWTTTEAFAPPE